MRTQTIEKYAARAKKPVLVQDEEKFEQAVGGLLVMRHDRDPRDAIYEELARLIPTLKVTGPQILVATYIRPDTTKGGIVITHKTRAEDEYQGKVGMVLAIGPTAFTESAAVTFGGLSAKVGDWIVYSPHDGLPNTLRGQTQKMHCRLIDDVQVRMIIEHPDSIL